MTPGTAVRRRPHTGPGELPAVFSGLSVVHYEEVEASPARGNTGICRMVAFRL